MKKEIVEIAEKELQVLREKKISRKEAIKKTGYIALSAATTMILLGTPKTASASPVSDRPAPPPSGGNNNNNNNNSHGPWKKH